MRLLIRFEDRYGMADIFCAANKINYFDNTVVREKVSDNLFVDTGLGNVRVLMLSDRDIEEIINLNIDSILFVFDTDNEKGLKNKVLSKEQITKKILDLQDRFNKKNYKINLHFFLTVYSAETIALYQYLSENPSLDIESYVSKYDTCALHISILTLLNNLDRVRKVKKFRNFLNIDILKHKIDTNLRLRADCINREVLTWIIHDCQGIDNSLAYDQVLNKLDETEKIISEQVSNTKTFKVSGTELKTDMSIKELYSIIDTNYMEHALKMKSST